MTDLACAICDKPAARKCTHCGKVFCNLHIRQGNPHFALGTVGGGAGWYCDGCWESYRELGRIAQRRTRLFLIVFGIFFCLMMLIFIIIMASVGALAFSIFEQAVSWVR